MLSTGGHDDHATIAKSAMITNYQAKYLAYELTKRCSAGG